MDNETELGAELREIIEPVVRAQGCELWEAAMAGPVGRRRLRVNIDAHGGVDVERCARVSRALSQAIEDPSLQMADVVLEVSSPGAERRLRGMDDYLRFLGER